MHGQACRFATGQAAESRAHCQTWPTPTIPLPTPNCAPEIIARFDFQLHCLRGIPRPMTDPELIAALIERFQTTCRHPSMRPLIIHQHNSNSLLDQTTHPEVSKPGVYVHYDDADRAFYIGSSGYPCGRN